MSHCSLSAHVRNIINNNIPDESDTGMIPIHPEIFIRHRSINLLVGKPGTSKTTSICEELIKLSAINIPEIHLIIWVNNTGSDQTLNTLKDYIKIPIKQIDYQDFDRIYPQFLQLKDDYNKMIRGEIPKDNSILEPLCLSNFINKPLETVIVLDDAVNILKETDSYLAKSLYKTRHTNCIFFIVIQIWKGITAQLKSIINSVWVFGGFSTQILHHIYNQITTDLSFDDFKSMYNQVQKYQKLICDNYSGNIVVL